MTSVGLVCSTGCKPNVSHCCHEDSGHNHDDTNHRDDAVHDIDLNSGEKEEEEIVFEPYTSERLDRLPGGYKILVEPQAIHTFNFNDPQAIQKIAEEGLSEVFTLPVSVQGRLDALVLWFDLHLDTENVLRTAPVLCRQDGACGATVAPCWEQAVYPVVLAQHCFTNENSTNNDDKFDTAMCCKSHVSDVHVQVGDRIRVEMRVDDAIRLTCRSLSKSHEIELECDDTTSVGCSKKVVSDCRDTTCVEGSNNFSCLNASDSVSNQQIFYLERSVIGELNNLHLNEARFHAIRNVNSKFKTRDAVEADIVSNKDALKVARNVDGQQKLASRIVTGANESFIKPTVHTELRMLDLTPHFTLLPIRALLMDGVQEVCVVDGSSETLYKRLLALNNISSDRLTVKADSDMEELGSDWDIIVFDVVEPSGCLRQHVLEDIALARMKCLRVRGVIMPTRLIVRAQLIHSLDLLEDSCVVDDSRTEPFHVASHINRFQARTHRDIDLSTLHYTAVTEVFSLFTLEFNENSTVLSDSQSLSPLAAQRIPADKCINQQTTFAQATNKQSSCCDQPGAPSFLNTECQLRQSTVLTSRVTALVYWFDIALTDNVTVSTFREGDVTSHWKQAAIMLTAEDLVVNVGDELYIDAVCNNSNIDVFVSKVLRKCDNAIVCN